MFWRVPPRAGAAAPGRIKHSDALSMWLSPSWLQNGCCISRHCFCISVKKKREQEEREKEKRCVPVCLLLSGRQQFPGSPTSFTFLIDTSLATVGDLVISSNLGFWQESILTLLFKSELEVRWRRGGYCVKQPMLAMTKVWLSKMSSHGFSFLPFQCALAMEEFKAGLIHFYVNWQLTWRSVLCLVWLGAGSKLNKTALAWSPLDPTV